MARTHQVLLTAVADGVARQIVEPLRIRGHAVHSIPWNDGTLDLATTTAFDAIVVGFPVTGVSLGRFLSAVRADESPCRHCGVVLLARPDTVRQARQFIGHGANRVVATSDVPLRLVRNVVELLQVAPRLRLRLPTRIVLRIDSRPLKALCQTENVSRTGMLLRGFGHYPQGTSLEFELALPGDVDPVCGAAEVSRSTNIAREHVKGFGARFTSFTGAGQQRLADFLETVH